MFLITSELEKLESYKTINTKGVVVGSFPRSVELKVNRAAEQAEILKDEIDTWTRDNPVRYRTEMHGDGMGFRVLHEGFLSPPPTDRWSLIFGELIHNLRSALDNLAWGFACAKANPPSKPVIIKFPIYEEEAKFDKKTKDITDQMTSDIAECIKAMQPFEQSDPDKIDRNFLVLLQNFNNDDKHTVPYISFTSFKTFQGFVEIEQISDGRKFKLMLGGIPEWDGTEPLQAGTVLVDQPFSEPIKPCEVKVNFELCFSLNRKGKLTPVGWMADFLVKQIDPLVKTFIPYFKVIDAGRHPELQTPAAI